MESVIAEEVPVKRKRRSSIFFAPDEEVNVDVKFTKEVPYPPDYYDKLQDEYKQWKETCIDLKNTVLTFRKELEEKVKHTIDLTILDKDQQQFFKNAPAIYFKYIKTFEEFIDEVHITSVVAENSSKTNKELAINLEEQQESVDNALKIWLQKVTDN